MIPNVKFVILIVIFKNIDGERKSQSSEGQNLFSLSFKEISMETNDNNA